MATKECPKCEAVIGENETTCPSCNVVIADFEDAVATVESAQAAIERKKKKNAPPPPPPPPETKKNALGKLASLGSVIRKGNK